MAAHSRLKIDLRGFDENQALDLYAIKYVPLKKLVQEFSNLQSCMVFANLGLNLSLAKTCPKRGGIRDLDLHLPSVPEFCKDIAFCLVRGSCVSTEFTYFLIM